MVSVLVMPWYTLQLSTNDTNTMDKRTNNDLQNITQVGARHWSGFLTCMVLHLSGNFILKRAESTCVLPLFYLYFNIRAEKNHHLSGFRCARKIVI
jgi:hypothetical protein